MKIRNRRRSKRFSAMPRHSHQHHQQQEQQQWQRWQQRPATTKATSTPTTSTTPTPTSNNDDVTCAFETYWKYRTHPFFLRTPPRLLGWRPRRVPNAHRDVDFLANVSGRCWMGWNRGGWLFLDGLRVLVSRFFRALLHVFGFLGDFCL